MCMLSQRTCMRARVSVRARALQSDCLACVHVQLCVVCARPSACACVCLCACVYHVKALASVCACTCACACAYVSLWAAVLLCELARMRSYVLFVRASACWCLCVPRRIHMLEQITCMCACACACACVSLCCTFWLGEVVCILVDAECVRACACTCSNACAM
jgi:hypothetical protein